MSEGPFSRDAGPIETQKTRKKDTTMHQGIYRIIAFERSATAVSVGLNKFKETSTSHFLYRELINTNTVTILTRLQTRLKH